jgi:hypothetical protein
MTDVTDSWLVAVDPGLRHLGVAIFFNGILYDVLLVKNPQLGRGAEAWYGYTRAKTDLPSSFREIIEGADHLVVEMQQVYRRGPGDPNDLLQVAGVAGVVVGLANLDARVTGYLPREWKGQVQKDVFAKRILTRLDSAEMFKFNSKKIAKSLVHNCVDAIGLGLKALGRL